MSEFLSVVICTYNRAESLRRAVETVITQETSGTFTFEIVIIDDHSTDHTRGTVEELSQRAPSIRYVANGASKGIAGARNSAVHAARGEWLVFFDDDQLADPNWLLELLSVARTNGAKIAGGGRRLDLGAAALAALGPVCRSLLGENLYDGPPTVMLGKELPTTGNLLLSREVFDRVGDFDERLTVSSGEDAELITRARAAGFDVWTAPRAIVAHMIPDYRTQVPYLRWVSRRWGVQFAQIDAKRRGKIAALALAVARTAQALLIRVPEFVIAKAQRNATGALDARCYLWRAEGYVHKALFLFSPTVFPQHGFLGELEFRNERQMFGGG